MSEADVSEILLTGLGQSRANPHLIAMVDKDLVIYTAFPYQQQSPAPSGQGSAPSGHLHVRFSKVSHTTMTRQPYSSSPLPLT